MFVTICCFRVNFAGRRLRVGNETIWVEKRSSRSDFHMFGTNRVVEKHIRRDIDHSCLCRLFEAVSDADRYSKRHKCR